MANPLAYIPPQCFTDTRSPTGPKNPCYVCHADSPAPNFSSDSNLQTKLAFPIGAVRNLWSNLFAPPITHAPAWSDADIESYVRQSNYFDANGDIVLAKTLTSPPPDWDIDGRAETITAQTPTGTVLDAARSFTDFSAGEYAVYTICGDVDFVLTRTAGANAVVSGVFFGTPSSTAPAATLTTKALVDSRGALSQVVAETDGTGALTAYYVRVQDQLLAVMRPGTTAGTWTTRFVHEDALGSVRTLTDEEGNVVDARGYEAFGTKNVEAGSDPLAYGFAGEPLDAQTRLAYHRARWMDSRSGRFSAMDPFAGLLEAPATLQKYVYVANEPSDLMDANGRISPQSLIIGTAVHKALYQSWINGEQSTTLNDRVADKSISTLLGLGPFPWSSNWLYKLKYGVSTLARPDLTALREHEIYEIKSNDEFGQGEAKLAEYLNLLNALDPADEWSPGGDDEFTPPEEYWLTSVGGLDYVIEIDGPVGGVITYTWQNVNIEAVAAAVGAGIGLGLFGEGPVAGVSGMAGF